MITLEAGDHTILDIVQRDESMIINLRPKLLLKDFGDVIFWNATQ